MANLQFLADWTSVLTGDLAQGEKLAIEFDPRRLPQCRLNWRGAEVWDITGYARFHPSGEVFSGSLLQRIAPSGGRCDHAATDPVGSVGAVGLELRSNYGFTISTR